MIRWCFSTLMTLPLMGCISTGVRDFEVTPPTTLDTQVGSDLVLLLPSGNIVVESSRDDQLHASVRFFCSADSDTCRKKAQEAGIVHTQQGTTSTLSFKPSSAYTTRHADLRFRIQVPAVDQLSIEMDAGSLSVDMNSGCLDVKAGAGDVTISVPVNTVKKVMLDANIGDANLSIPDGEVFDERKLLVGSEVLWDQGAGSCNLKAKLQAGEVSVTLTQP
ncbi:MAG: hypothetical protein NWP69_09000 [Congregibacter sp.]|nr:hypothetical protein [Congregibacter sp.]MDP5071251.1 hypothetical protein [Congregibacter sp.]